MYNINKYRKLFKDYTNDFFDKASDSIIKQNIELKTIHSLNVNENCRLIAESENLNDINTFIAELCGLFHDIGRFEQYFRYNTFKDNDSVYHGQLGVEVLDYTGFLNKLPEKIKTIVLTAVYSHGLFRITENTKNEELFFSKLTRDADKIDIYRIVAEYYHKNRPRNIALEYGLIDSSYISIPILDSIKNGNLVSKKDLKTLNDFKVMQLSWIFDINFEYSREVIFKNNYLHIILDSIQDIPQKKEIEKIFYKNI